MSIKRFCIVCDKELKPVHDSDSEDIQYPPNGGIYLQSHGNYGSRVFDSMTGEFLECYICDECLESKKDKIYILTPRIKQSVKYQTMKEYENG